MEKNSLSYSRVSAWLVVHQILELQLTAPLRESATKFITTTDTSVQVPLYFLTPFR